MHNATAFLAHQRIIEARRQAAQSRLARPSLRHPRKPRSLLDRIRGDY
jgi:hypothetical protein